jgi:signal transduction histidine kinase
MSEIILCTDTEITEFQIFDFSIAPDLLLYSYVPMALISVAFGLFILLSAKKAAPGTRFFFFLLSIVFSVHLLNELLQWVYIPAGLMFFGWGVSLLLHALIAYALFNFVVSFAYNKPPSFKTNLITTALFLPIILLIPTELSLLGFDPDWCGAIDGPIWMYMYLLEAITTVSFLLLCLYSGFSYIKKRTLQRKKEVLLFSSAFLFSLIFFGSEFLGSITHFYEINFVGPIGMLLFLTSFTFMIVRYGVLNIKLIGAQVLVVALVSMIASQLFFVNTPTLKILVLSNLLLSILGGHFLILSVLKEVRQRKELEVLTTKLEAANSRLRELDKQKSEFVSIASHQLRSPLTAIRGYASMLAEGSFGKMPEKAAESAKRIEDSAKLMAMSIEDYLNVSRIESGNMKYNNSDFNVRDMVDNLCDDLRPEALKKNLILLFRSNLQSRGVVHADVGKTNQIIHNLINNSLKYTQKGSVSVFVRDDIKKKRVYIDITDTGIGMSKETIAKLFHKFSRADNANSVNVSGTGLGLFVALKMAQAMGGDITCQSEGDGKGSTFTIELPLAM